MQDAPEIYREYLRLVRELETFEKEKIPLCAAETNPSPFVRSALGSVFEGKYCMNRLAYDEAHDFIGSEYIHRLYGLLGRQCEKLFGCRYADARTLSGLNCLSTVIQGLLPKGSRVLMTDPDQGGHPSLPVLLHLAGVQYDPIPYDYAAFDLDYGALNARLAGGDYAAVVLAQSDVLRPADVSKIEAKGALVIYDGTQTLGMIAAHVHRNPLGDATHALLIGGTHKTLPGPTCGLILTKDMPLAERLDPFISPQYLRNTQPDHIAAVLLALIEQEIFGREYQNAVIENANYLGEVLSGAGFRVLRLPDGSFTKTHQIFLAAEEKEKERITENARAYAVTLNGKHKKLFGGHGIRLGLQEISLYGWKKDELNALAAILCQLNKEKPDGKRIDWLKEKLAQKKRYAYLFSDGLTK